MSNTESMPKQKVVAYVRVSTVGQAEEGFSLETQRQFLEDYALGHGLSITRFFEEAHSAYRPGRPEFDSMLEYLKQCEDVNAVLVYKLDRLWRNESDHGAMLALEDVKLISATEAIPDGSTGRLITTLLSGVARFSSDQTSERVLDAARKKVRDGGWPGQAPIGYVNNREEKTIGVDPIMGPLVTHLFETYARQDISLSRLVKLAKKLGLKSHQGNYFAKGSIHHMLTNSFYHGEINWNGETHPGNHTPLVSKTLFHTVQERLKAKSSPATKHEFAYRGLLVCARCGCAVTASRVKDIYTYYHCTGGRGGCVRKFVREEEISTQFEEVLKVLRLSEEQVAFLMEEIESGAAKRRSEAKRQRVDLERERNRVELLREKAYEDKLLEKVSEDRWLALDSQWDEKLRSLEERLSLLDSTNEPALDEAEAAFKLLNRAPELYRRQSHRERADLLRLLLSNSHLDGKKLVPVYRKPFDLVAEGLQSSIWLPG